MPLPITFNRVPVRGRFVDLEGNHVAGKLTFTVSVSAMQVAGSLVTVIGKPLVVFLVNGYFETQLPATNDPDVAPNGFVYTVEESFSGLPGRTYKIAVPVEAESGGLDLALVVPPADPNEVYQFSVLSIDGGTATSIYTSSTDGGGA